MRNPSPVSGMFEASSVNAAVGSMATYCNVCLPSAHLYSKLQACSSVRPVAPVTIGGVSPGASFVGRIAILQNTRTASAACFLPQGMVRLIRIETVVKRCREHQWA